MSNRSNSDDLFENLRQGLSDFGKKVGNFVDDVMASETLSGSDVKIRTDIYQDGDFYVIELELPGMTKKEVSIQIHEGVLQVKGFKRANEEAHSYSYSRQERQFGSFLKSFDLPSDVELENIKASYESGVLSIRFPRPQPQNFSDPFDTEEEDDGTSINID
jgi:HSP20 family protein